MFSIVIPYYKKRKYIERCIDSVLDQSYTDFEIILVDDGSQDDIYELTKGKYLNKVQLITQENQGVASARNKGISEAKNLYVAFLDADDYWSPFYLAKMVSVIKTENQPCILGCNYSRIKSVIETTNEKLTYKCYENFFKRDNVNIMYTSSTVVIKRDFFINNEGFDRKIKRGEDLDVWIRVLEKAKSAIFITNVLCYYSDEDQNQVTQQIGKLEHSLLGIINEKYQDLFNNKNHYFNYFVSKFIYYHLLNYYFDKNQHIVAKNVLSKNNKRFFLLEWPYWLPLRVGKKINKTPLLKKLMLYYFKVIFKFI